MHQEFHGGPLYVCVCSYVPEKDSVVSCGPRCALHDSVVPLALRYSYSRSWDPLGHLCLACARLTLFFVKLVLMLIIHTFHFTAELCAHLFCSCVVYFPSGHSQGPVFPKAAPYVSDLPTEPRNLTLEPKPLGQHRNLGCSRYRQYQVGLSPTFQ